MDIVGHEYEILFKVGEAYSDRVVSLVGFFLKKGTTAFV
jgi:hypothetical protein